MWSQTPEFWKNKKGKGKTWWRNRLWCYSVIINSIVSREGFWNSDIKWRKRRGCEPKGSSEAPTVTASGSRHVSLFLHRWAIPHASLSLRHLFQTPEISRKFRNKIGHQTKRKKMGVGEGGVIESLIHFVVEFNEGFRVSEPSLPPHLIYFPLFVFKFCLTFYIHVSLYALLQFHGYNTYMYGCSFELSLSHPSLFFLLFV